LPPVGASWNEPGVKAVSDHHQPSCDDCANPALRLVLADTSAWHRSTRAPGRWTDLLETGLLAICTPVALELLFSPRIHGAYHELARDLAYLPTLQLDRQAETIAASTQAALAVRGQHRGATPIDLLIAAVAEVHGAILLHYDRHFDAIARITGQQTEWLARRGSLD
jgi:predicted nucleic acid-binding protein